MGRNGTSSVPMQQSIHDSCKTTCPSTLPLDYPGLRVLLLLHILLQKKGKKKEEDSTQKQQDRNFYLSHIKVRADREGGLASPQRTIKSYLEQMNKIDNWWCDADAHRAIVACDWDPMSLLN